MSHIAKSVFVVAAAVALAAPPTQAGNNSYHVEKLVADVAGAANHLDPNLVNPWGVAFNPNGVVWVSDNGTGLSTLYDGLGNVNSLVVAIPPAPGSTAAGLPTGIVFSGSSDFAVTNGTATPAPARFIFATQDGVIAGWAPSVDATHAQLARHVPGASYTGLALASTGTGNFLYAADFLHGRIDVFDRTFTPVPMPGAFVDPKIPADFAPFNIQNILGDLYITYAKHEAGEADEIAGPGLGFVSVFDAKGNFIRRVASRGKLNAPWGVALAPASFGRFAGHLLVGNFGDGTINAYDARTGAARGQLRDTSNKPLKIDGLWGIAFGNGINNQPTNTLFFAAGTGDEAHGLYGAITAVPGGNDNGNDGEGGDED